MNKETNKNIPELRFPEFVEDGEWVEKRFGDIGEFLGGGTPSRSNSEYWIGNIPWISSSDISEEDIHNISISQFINEEAVKASATKIIPKGSILFVSRVGVGKLAINKKAELCTSQDFTNFLPTKVLNYFIAYYFSANKNLLKSLSQGTSIQGFSKSDLEDFKIGYPVSSEEQQKIANCLSSLDEVIAAHSQKLELLKEHKKGLMQNLFPQEGETVPKYRFPEFVNDGEWVKKRFGDIGEFLGGGTPSRSNSEYWIGNIPWISSSDISEEDIHNISISQFINEEAVKASATKIIPKGSILFVSRVGVGKLAINKKAELCTSQDFTNFLPTKVLNYFIAYYFSANKNLLKSLSQGTSIQGFSKSDLEDFKIAYPVSSEEQQKIATCLSSLDSLITAQSEKIEQLKLHKKGLMQGLFPPTV
ncbi:MAG: restriction endonuclease subunit S [Bacteroidales bacterium]|nr:restriction endonuclease subunit S [Bacteroidales bacterium]